MPDIAVFDPHWRAPAPYQIKTARAAYSIAWYELGQRAGGVCAALLMDEYAATSLRWFVPRRKRIAVIKETPLISRLIDASILERDYDLVLTHRRDLLDRGHPFHRLDFSTTYVQDVSPEGLPQTKKHLASFVGSVQHELKEGYALRMDVANRLRDDPRIDLYGRGIRQVEHKSEALLPYCFSVAIENASEDYYYTEKIIDCFLCRTVPIYWGCPSIAEIFDERGMLTFSDMEGLGNLLNGLSFDLYQQMAPFVEENLRRCMDQQLCSFSSYLERIIRVAEGCGLIDGERIGELSASKVAAGVRWANSYGRCQLPVWSQEREKLRKSSG